MPTRLLYPIAEALELLGNMGRSTFYEEVKAGRLRITKVRSRTMVASEDLDAYAELLRSEATPDEAA